MSETVGSKEAEVSSTWELRRLPSYWKTGQVLQIAKDLELAVVDVFKKSPSNSAYIKFKTVSEKLRAKPLLESYTNSKLPRGVECREHRDRAAALHHSIRKRKKGKADSSKRPVGDGPIADGSTESKSEEKSVAAVVTPYGHWPYEKQLDVKHKSVCQLAGKFRTKLYDSRTWNSAFLRYLPSHRKELCRVHGIVASPVTEYYRNKDILSFGVSQRKAQQPCAGFCMGRFQSGIDCVEPVEVSGNCKHLSPVTAYICQFLTQFIDSVFRSAILPKEHFSDAKHLVYSKRTHKGVFRKCLIRSNVAKEYIVCLTIQDSGIVQSLIKTVASMSESISSGSEECHFRKETVQKLADLFVAMLRTENDTVIKPKTGFSLKGIALEIHNGASDIPSVGHSETRLLFGDDFLIERLCGLRFKVSLTSFFQCNTRAAEKLYECVAHFVMSEGRKPQGDVVLFDVCCGTGTIGMALCSLLQQRSGGSLRIKKVFGLEMIESAVLDARKNALLNNKADVCEFICGKAEDTLKQALATLKTGDRAIAILDPPRPGLHASVLKAIRKQWRIDKVAYVSCNPKTCFADALRLCAPPSKRLSGRPFKPVSAVSMDLYPHTTHVEMLLTLDRCRLPDLDFTHSCDKYWVGCGYFPDFKDETPPPAFDIQRAVKSRKS